MVLGHSLLTPREYWDNQGVQSLIHRFGCGSQPGHDVKAQPDEQIHVAALGYLDRRDGSETQGAFKMVAVLNGMRTVY